MTDASIPLSVQPPKFENPVDAYARMLSLKNMRAQYDQNQQLAPLVLQQQEAAAKEAQMRELQMQQGLRDQQIMAEEFRRAASTPPEQPAAAQPAATAQPANQPAGQTVSQLADDADGDQPADPSQSA